MTWRWTLFVWRLVRRKTTALLNSRHGNIFTWERGAAVLDLEIHFSRWNSIWSPKVLEHAWSYISEKQYEEFHNTFSLTHSFGRECCLIADVWGCDPLVCNSIEEERYTWWCFFLTKVGQISHQLSSLVNLVTFLYKLCALFLHQVHFSRQRLPLSFQLTPQNPNM